MRGLLQRTLDLWATDQFFFFSFSPGKKLLTLFVVQGCLTRGIRRFDARVQDPPVCGVSWCTNSSLSPLLVKVPTLLNGLFPIILSRLRSSLLLVHLFFPHFSLPHNFLSVCFDTALWEHPNSFAINFWGFPSLWRKAQPFLHNCQVCSLPHDRDSYWTRLRDHLNAQEPFAGVLD